MGPDRLLVLEDEIAVAELMARVGAQCGFEVRVAFDTDTFWHSYTTFEPTLIVADLNVPGARDGAIVEALAERGCRAGVIVTSGSDPESLAAIERAGRARGLAMAGMMTKPFRLSDLRRRLVGIAGAGDG